MAGSSPAKTKKEMLAEKPYAIPLPACGGGGCGDEEIECRVHPVAAFQPLLR
jgi:hypothetical protein